jgi:hypothetical protein
LAILEILERSTLPDLWLPSNFSFSTVPIDFICKGIIDRTKKLMVDSVDVGLKEKVNEVLKNISNDSLFALTAVLDGVYKKYIAEDRSPDGGSNSGGDAAALQAEAQKIMSSPEYKDFRFASHDAAKQRVQDIFKQIASMQK